MQIRLTVLSPLSGHAPRTRDVLVTAPAGTALATVASGLAAAVAAAEPERGADPGGPAARSGAVRETGTAVLYAGSERLDGRHCFLGEPPLLDGAVLSLNAPAAPGSHPGVAQDVRETAARRTPRLHVVAGPDAGGVHLLHGGQVRIGRSADADVPLDDPDVSRLHCAVTVADDGRVTVADLGSTNGTALDGAPVDERPRPLPPGALLRVGESALRLEPAPAAGPSGAPEGLPTGATAGMGPGPDAAHPAGAGSVAHARPHAPRPPAVLPGALPVTPDGEGRLRVERPGTGGTTAGLGTAQLATAGPGALPGAGTARPEAAAPGAVGSGAAGPAAGPHGSPGSGAARHTGTDHGAPGHRTPDHGAPEHGTPGHGTPQHGGAGPREGGWETGRGARLPRQRTGGYGAAGAGGHPVAEGRPDHQEHPGRVDRYRDHPDHRDHRDHPDDLRARPDRPDPAPPAPGRGIGAWARRLTGGRPGAERPAAGGAASAARSTSTAAAALHRRWPDPAEILLTALGPGPRLWERGPAHPDALVVRLGTADRAGVPSYPVTVGLRQAGSLGLAGPRARLAGLARSVVAQLAALHSPAALELVLISADPARRLRDRMAEWAWLGWLPQLRPAHGQDCRLLLAYDGEQAAARIAELARQVAETPPGGTAGPAARSGPQGPYGPPADQGPGPYTVVVLDGDPGSAELREATTRLAVAGPAAGVHLLCAVETPAASPAAPLLANYERACAVSPAFGECGAVAMLSGEVATALRVIQLPADRRGGSAPAGGHGSPGGTAGRPHSPRATPAPSGPRAPGAPGALGSSDGGSSRGGTAARSGAPTPPDAGRSPAPHGDPGRTHGLSRPLPDPAAGPPAPPPVPPPAGLPDNGTAAVADAVSAAWAERFARSLAPLRLPDPEPAAAAASGAAVPDPAGSRRVAVTLPRAARLLDELGLARATPASLTARWAAASDPGTPPGGRLHAVLGAGPHGPLTVDVAVDGPHLLVEGGPGTGKTELLRSLAASLAAADRPDRLAMALVDGGGLRSERPETRDEGLRVCTELPQVTTHVSGVDPVRMRAFAQALTAELKRRDGLLGGVEFTAWHARHPAPAGRTARRGAERGRERAAERTGEWRLPRPGGTAGAGSRPVPAAGAPGGPGAARPGAAGAVPSAAGAPEPPGARAPAGPEALPRLVVLVDDLDALLSPALGSPGRPAAGSMVRALEAVARDGARLGVHLIASTGRPECVAGTATAAAAGVRVALEVLPPVVDGPEKADATAGRGRLTGRAGPAVPFQAGRVTGRIPRTATQRPTVVPLDWERMGDPPARRPVRELGNGPTDLALLASALQRAAESAGAAPAPPLV
ncbi:FHA domain-containing protein [Streptomyces zingiberis]|uniref:FHA domain-containing protein n=1 Tax=Streptomyces zingiberis TaxID=2053010 RepID=A0ABX1BVM4_9ACTN|nr:FHA domain-containing protein [Streptomyces zingiberis]NJQ01771.1 FHA domain-containing protein [Streptomyces zingiberis]